ncbi:MAG TPA: DUF4878 domain-containing protein [Mycobacterium sp.]|nr:DUF4878 domain-containing protein [Mycobacterium sp.]
MSTPSGPDQENAQAPDDSDPPEETPEPDEPEAAVEVPVPSEAPTEVISTTPEPESSDAGDRRYTAPSAFDVSSTEKIENAPEPATEVITTSPSSTSRPAAPQEIPPRPGMGRHRSWLLVAALILAIIVVAAVVVYVIILATHDQSPKLSQQDQVRQAIQDFDTAVQKGDLAQLRSITCGDIRDNYLKMPDDDWAKTYQRIAAAKQYPMVASIDEVAVNDQHAEANVTTFMAYAPQVRSTRSFDLQYLDGGWKICEGPIS